MDLAKPRVPAHHDHNVRSALKKMPFLTAVREMMIMEGRLQSGKNLCTATHRSDTVRQARRSASRGHSAVDSVDDDNGETNSDNGPHGETVVVWGKEVVVCQKSLGFLQPCNKIRHLALHIVEWSQFDRIILSAIFLNSLLLLVTLSRADIKESEVSDIVEMAFTILFTLEMLFKILAVGLILDPLCYLRSSWNCLDCLVVFTAWFELAGSGLDISALRCIRLLRPLRSLQGYPGMRLIVATILQSIPRIANLVLLALFVFGLFAVLGMNLMGHVYWNRCRLTPQPLPTGEWPVDPTQPRLCGGDYLCQSPVDLTHASSEELPSAFWDSIANRSSVEVVCGNLLDFRPNQREDVWTALEDDETLDYGYTGFGNFGTGLLLVFQVATMEGWTDLMYRYSDGFGTTGAVIYFLLLVLIGSLVVFNLVMAIMLESYDELNAAHQQKEQAELKLHVEDRLGEQHQLDHIMQNFETLEEVILFCSRLEQLEFYNNATSFASSAAGGLWRFHLRRFIESKMFSVGMMVAIVLNSAVLAMDQHPPPPDQVQQWLDMLNLIFLVLFTIELLLKLLAVPWRKFKADSWNVFDMAVVLGGLLEFAIQTATNGEGGGALSALRSGRLLRILKLARNWISLRVLLLVLARGLRLSVHIVALAILFLYIYTLMGMQFFGQKRLGDPPDRPRLHFDDPLSAFLTVFVVLTGEDWPNIMFETGYVTSDHPMALIYFLSLIIFGNAILLNLVMAILASAFTTAREKILAVYKEEVLQYSHQEQFTGLLNSFLQEQKRYILKKKENEWMVEVPLENGWWLLLAPVRDKCRALVSWRHFDHVCLMLIMISSALLAVDTPQGVDPNSETRQILDVIDVAFTIAFTGEMMVKMLAFGFNTVPDGYFRDKFNWLDFIVVGVSLITPVLQQGGGGSVAKIFRAIRALRPLRMVQRNPGLKILVDALISSIPPITNTILVGLLFYLIYAILGVSFFKGKFYTCAGVSDDRSYSEAECIAAGGTWENSKMNFDNVMEAVYSLFVVSLGPGWYTVMLDAIDTTELDRSRVRDASPLSSMYFVIFMFFGNFFILNLFVGIIVDQLQNSKKSAESGKILMTEEQETWCQVVRTVLISVPPVSLEIRTEILLDALHADSSERSVRARIMLIKLVSSKFFEGGITLCIILNMLVMCARYADQPGTVRSTFDMINLAFTGIFNAEAILKLLALRSHYFAEPWNKFDFVVVLGTDAFFILGIFLPSGGVISKLGPVIRSLRVMRMIRLIRRAKGLLRLFRTMLHSLGSLVNAGCLLCLFLYIYTCLCMSLFGKIGPGGEILGDQVNFATFGTALLTNIGMATGELWESLIYDLAGEQEGCVVSQEYADYAANGPRECGTPLAYVVFISFQVLIGLTIMQLFVGVVLEGFAECEVDERIELIQEQRDHFFEGWSKRLPKGGRLMKVDDCIELLLSVSYPIGFGSDQSSGKVRKDDHWQMLVLQMMAADDMPLWTGSVHLHDVACFVCKRACSQIAFGSPMLAHQVSLEGETVEMFRRQFPELDGRRLKNMKGVSFEPEFRVSDLFAVRNFEYFYIKRILRQSSLNGSKDSTSRAEPLKANDIMFHNGTQDELYEPSEAGSLKKLSTVPAGVSRMMNAGEVFQKVRPSPPQSPKRSPAPSVSSHVPLSEDDPLFHNHSTVDCHRQVEHHHGRHDLPAEIHASHVHHGTQRHNEHNRQEHCHGNAHMSTDFEHNKDGEDVDFVEHSTPRPAPISVPSPEIDRAMWLRFGKEKFGDQTPRSGVESFSERHKHGIRRGTSVSTCSSPQEHTFATPIQMHGLSSRSSEVGDQEDASQVLPTDSASQVLPTPSLIHGARFDIYQSYLRSVI